ncbi:MAG: hypothetical protein K6F09_07370 [Clostridiales bacterium]|nr:hypothetical protein [Clostridiales bacterium]
MKRFKTVIVLLCILALTAGSVAFILTDRKPLPEKREVLVEPVPEVNELRSYEGVDGVGGSKFYIQFPKSESFKTVSVSQFGATPDNPNNADALNDAFNFCKDNPGTHLLFDKGTYYVSGQLILDNIKDALIDGNGATILYDHGSSFFTLRHCECVKVCGLTYEWDWEKMPLSATARAVKVKGEKNTLDFIFDDPDFAREDMFYAVSQCDPDTDTYGAKGTYIESYDGQNPEVIKKLEKIGEDTIRVVHNGAWAHFGGNAYILRSTAYGGSLIDITEQCRDITLDGLKLYGGTGMGIIVGEKTSHFILRSIFIGPDPEKADIHYTSLDADAVHINDSDGCFLIENCDFSRQGDDDVNINSGIGLIRSVNGRTVTFEADGSMNVDPGDTVRFRNTRFDLMEFTAVAESCGYDEDGYRQVTFSDDLPKSIKKGCFLFNRDNTGGNYVIRNNYFHEHRARSLLLQTSDGLVENNVFYKMTHNAIKIIMDINGVWHEGTGADNIIVRNNRFIECSVIGTEIIEVGTHLLDKSNHSYAFTNIRIENNEFRDICGNLMVVNNVNNFVFKNNTVTLGNAFRNDVGKGRSYFLADCINVDISDNDYTDLSPTSLARIARSNSPIVWLRVNFGTVRGKDGAK